ncbi:hypothetical protein BC829DRAFT_137329 [Chytridium lagenaria]|nr:hypothetical protein BC829DRAFT_137329 [Chytridium lagenaria]
MPIKSKMQSALILVIITLPSSIAGSFEYAVVIKILVHPEPCQFSDTLAPKPHPTYVTPYALNKDTLSLVSNTDPNVFAITFYHLNLHQIVTFRVKETGALYVGSAEVIGLL